MGEAAALLRQSRTTFDYSGVVLYDMMVHVSVGIASLPSNGFCKMYTIGDTAAVSQDVTFPRFFLRQHSSIQQPFSSRFEALELSIEFGMDCVRDIHVQFASSPGYLFYTFFCPFFVVWHYPILSDRATEALT